MGISPKINTTAFHINIDFKVFKTKLEWNILIGLVGALSSCYASITIAEVISKKAIICTYHNILFECLAVYMKRMVYKHGSLINGITTLDSLIKYLHGINQSQRKHIWMPLIDRCKFHHTIQLGLHKFGINDLAF